ncbi:hypothetical protein [Mucilaginibacter antarcticus]|uniref:hypothetical protein n=1 Tax=Mucilaginibacter antarcticus TaxID=1855725 RepID=UPI0036457502
MVKRFTALFLTQLCLVTVIALALNLNFCNDALAGVKSAAAAVTPPGINYCRR